MQTNWIILVLVKNCSPPLDNVYDSNCKTPRFDLGRQQGDGVLALAGQGLGCGSGWVGRRNRSVEEALYNPRAKTWWLVGIQDWEHPMSKAQEEKPLVWNSSAMCQTSWGVIGMTWIPMNSRWHCWRNDLGSGGRGHFMALGSGSGGLSSGRRMTRSQLRGVDRGLSEHRNRACQVASGTAGGTRIREEGARWCGPHRG